MTRPGPGQPANKDSDRSDRFPRVRGGDPPARVTFLASHSRKEGQGCESERDREPRQPVQPDPGADEDDQPGRPAVTSTQNLILKAALLNHSNTCYLNAFFHEHESREPDMSLCCDASVSSCDSQVRCARKWFCTCSPSVFSCQHDS